MLSFIPNIPQLDQYKNQFYQIYCILFIIFEVVEFAIVSDNEWNVLDTIAWDWVKLRDLKILMVYTVAPIHN